MNPLSHDFWYGILTAVVCGFIVGLERQLRGKPAGVRTAILICLGTELFVHLGASIPGAQVDASRVLGQVVTGVGFLGAGVMLTREGVVLGVTTASVIWVLAAIGSIVGLGYYAAAMAIALIVVSVLLGSEFIEHSFKSLRRGVHAEHRLGEKSVSESEAD